jgi:hypothetical protein
VESVTRGSQFGIVIRNVRRRIIFIIFNIGLSGSLVPRPLVEEEPVRKRRKFTTTTNEKVNRSRRKILVDERPRWETIESL